MEAVIRLGCDARIAVSSAYVAMSVWSVSGMSAVKMEYRKGPSMLPCGTTEWTSCSVVYSDWYRTWKVLSERYNFMRVYTGCGKASLNLYNSPVCHTLSKA